jgi:hypothetical protein
MKTVEVGLVANHVAYAGRSFKAVIYVPETYMRDGLVDFEALKKDLSGQFAIHLKPIARAVSDFTD